MSKKVVVLLIIILLIIAVTAFFMLRPEKPYYTEEPKDWIEERAAGAKEVNVDKVTAGAGEVWTNTIQYDDGLVRTALSLYGLYQGNYFTEEYADEQGKVRMRISSEMNPDDGIIEAFIVERIKDNKPVAYVFVDEDWKRAMPQAMIVWGASFQRSMPFKFTEVEDGIYLTTFDDDPERFYSVENGPMQKRGGIAVGDASSQDFNEETTTPRTAAILK